MHHEKKKKRESESAVMQKCYTSTSGTQFDMHKADAV